MHVCWCSFQVEAKTKIERGGQFTDQTSSLPPLPLPILSFHIYSLPLSDEIPYSSSPWLQWSLETRPWSFSGDRGEQGFFRPFLKAPEDRALSPCPSAQADGRERCRFPQRAHCSPLSPPQGPVLDGRHRENFELCSCLFRTRGPPAAPALASLSSGPFNRPFKPIRQQQDWNSALPTAASSRVHHRTPHPPRGPFPPPAR